MSKEFTIYYTSDTHGHIFPVNYAANCAEDGGLLNLAHKVKKDGNTLVLDGGDSLQGTPLTQYYLENRSVWPVHPVAAAFNAMGLDCFTLGNHDFNFGYEALRDFIDAMNAECLCANLTDLGGELSVRPWTVRTLENGLRVGITGVVTDFVNVWEQPCNMENLRISDAFTAAARAYEYLKGRCDVTVCIYHGGFEEDLSTGRLLSDSGENVGCKIARELGYDILLTGHQHMQVEGVELHGTYAVQPPANAPACVKLEASAGAGRVQCSSAMLQSGNEHSAEPYNTLCPLEEAVQSWLDSPVGLLTESVPPEGKLDVALYGSRVADLFNLVQLETTGADISCTSLGNDPIGLASPVTMRGITAAYLFANTLVVMEANEETIRSALERCASYFTLENGTPRVSNEFLLPKVEHYNYDFYAGISYSFDLRRPVGSRVISLTLPDGSPLGNKKYSLVTSNYRATGTGGYGALRCCRVLWRGGREMPDLTAEYVHKHSPLNVSRRGEMHVLW